MYMDDICYQRWSLSTVQTQIFRTKPAGEKEKENNSNLRSATGLP